MASTVLPTQPCASIWPTEWGAFDNQLDKKHAGSEIGKQRMVLSGSPTWNLVGQRESSITSLRKGIGSFTAHPITCSLLQGSPFKSTTPIAPFSGLQRWLGLSTFTTHIMHPDSVVHFYQAPRGKSVGVLSQAASLLSLSTNSMSAEARKLEEEAEVTPVSPDLPPIICFPGGGMFFYWMIGVVNVLQDQIDMTTAHMSGASAGALASVLAACGVDMRRAAEHAFQLSIDEKLWDRKLKLALVWGRLIRQWLWDLLPDNAAELCNGRVHLFVLELPGFRTGLHCKRVPITDFKDKADLIDCALASVHIPIFINGHIWTEYRGSRCVDGSINADRLALNIDSRRHTLYLDPYEDPEMKERGNRFLELYGDNPGPEGTWEWINHMMQRGEEHARRISSAGQLEPWTNSSMKMEAGG